MSDMDDLRDLYQELILDHGRHPRHFHAIEGAHHEAEGHNPLCGDRLVLYVKRGDDGTIADVGFQGEGCAISVASASLMTDILIGKTLKEAEIIGLYFKAIVMGEKMPDNIEAQISQDDIDRLAALAGVKHYPVRVKCATLAWRTFDAALEETTTEKVTTE